MEAPAHPYRYLLKPLVLVVAVSAMLVGATQASATSPEGTFYDCAFPDSTVPQGFNNDNRFNGAYTVCLRRIISLRGYELICEDGILYSRPDYLVVRDRLYFHGNATDGDVTWYSPTGEPNDRIFLSTSFKPNAQLFFTESRDSGEFDDPSQQVPIGTC